MTDKPERQDAAAHDHSAHEKLIQRVLHALGPASDGGQVATNISFAQKLVAALLELRLVHARSTEQDQPKKEDAPSKLGPREPHRGR